MPAPVETTLILSLHSLQLLFAWSQFILLFPCSEYLLQRGGRVIFAKMLSHSAKLSESLPPPIANKITPRLIMATRLLLISVTSSWLSLSFCSHIWLVFLFLAISNSFLFYIPCSNYSSYLESSIFARLVPYP